MLAGLLVAGLGPADSGSAWREFSPPDSGFSIRLPGKPKELENGPPGMRQFELKTGEEDYVVSFADVPEEMKGQPPEKVLERLRDDFVQSIPGARLTGSKPFDLGGQPGLAWNVEAFSAKDGSKFKMKMSAVVANNRLYHYGFIGPSDSFKEAAVDRFLETFQLLPPK